MPEEQLHRAQLYILYALRRSTELRYTDLRKPTGLDSDVFKFHVQKLQKRSLLAKNTDGKYELTSSGKELANNLDRTKRQIQKQPKLSVLLMISRLNEQGETEYLLQQRFRNPFYGYWGNITGPVRWGEAVEEATIRELRKQTGLSGSFEVKSVYRKRDYSDNTGMLLEDKLFTIVEVTNLWGELSNEWSGGHNAWIVRSKIKNLKGFNTLEVIGLAESGQIYYEGTASYSEAEY